jgi:hypothetical protein
MARFAPRCSGLFCVFRDEISRTDVEWEANGRGWRAGSAFEPANRPPDRRVRCRDLGMTAEELRRDWYDPNELDLTGEEIALLLG